jgi:CheY-like chemotaxis protein
VSFLSPAATSGAGGNLGPAYDRSFPARRSDVGDPVARRRILVVDDHPGAGESMSRLLASVGHDVRLVNSGPRALAAACEFHPEVVLLDLGLPGMDGTEVARRLRGSATSGRTALVAVTGWDGADIRRRTTEAGFDFHLVKPVDLAVIESLIDALDA